MGKFPWKLPKGPWRCWLWLLWSCVKCPEVTKGIGDHHKSTQLRALSGKASVWSCQNPPQKACLSQKGKVKLLMSDSLSCQQLVSQSFGSPETGSGAEVQEEASQGQEDTKSLQAGMGMRRRCHWPLCLCLLSPPVPALPPSVPFGCVRTFCRCHLTLRGCCAVPSESRKECRAKERESRDDSRTSAAALGTVLPCSTQRIIALLSPLYNQHPRDTLRKSYRTQRFPFLCSWAPSAVVASQVLLSPEYSVLVSAPLCTTHTAGAPEAKLCSSSRSLIDPTASAQAPFPLPFLVITILGFWTARGRTNTLQKSRKKHHWCLKQRNQPCCRTSFFPVPGAPSCRMREGTTEMLKTGKSRIICSETDPAVGTRSLSPPLWV